MYTGWLAALCRQGAPAPSSTRGCWVHEQDADTMSAKTTPVRSACVQSERPGLSKCISGPVRSATCRAKAIVRWLARTQHCGSRLLQAAGGWPPQRGRKPNLPNRIPDFPPTLCTEHTRAVGLCPSSKHQYTTCAYQEGCYTYHDIVHC